MKWPLVRKELRAALPLACLWWFFWGTGVFEYTLTRSPALTTFREAFEAYRNPAMVAVVGGIVAMWLANATFPAEHAVGTMEFMDSLPTSRDRMFAAKFGTGLALLWSGPALHMGVAYGFHAFSRTSLDDALYLGIAVPWLLLAWAELAVIFSFAVALSFLRRFAWLTAAVVVLAYLAVKSRFPQVSVLDVTALIEPAVMGVSLAAPWRLLEFQVPAGAACAAVAWLLFRGAGDRLVQAGERMSQGLLGRVALGVVAVCSIGAWIAVPVVVSLSSGKRHEKDEDKDEHGVVYVGWTRSHASTSHYTVTFPTSLAGTAAGVLVGADAVHDRVRQYFEAESIAQTDVDATGGGPGLYAGRAFHQAIQLDLAASHGAPDALAVLGHETSHLYIDAISNDRLSHTFSWTRCLHEGLASYVEHQLFRSEVDRARIHHEAALAHAWKKIEFEKFIDDRALTAERDPMLVYPVGEMLIEALVEVGGERAPVRLVRAFGRKDYPQDIDGVELWRDAFQAAGLNYEAVVSRFLAMLDAEVKRDAALIASVRRPRGRVLQQTDKSGTQWVGITPVLDIPLPGDWRVVVRFRRAATDKPEDFLPSSQNGGTYWVLRSALPGRIAGYQVGLWSAAEGVEAWDVWQEMTLGN